VAPFESAHSFIAAATIPATELSSFSRPSMAAWSFSFTSFGILPAMTRREKTSSPNISDGLLSFIRKTPLDYLDGEC
jgi:hypothetical protein